MFGGETTTDGKYMKHRLIERCVSRQNPEQVKLQMDLGADIDKDLVTTPRVMLKLVKFGIGTIYYWTYSEPYNKYMWHMLGDVDV